ncbi:hypothetical protein [Glaciihabitans tibetensis]|uniref:hypothetical protein n=1 Tax=Glaciihabitans tibetensis TaxID=1266600 RepID=UPI000D0821FD|nr:hypothetical protein [Glaciihabitans tibetensis]
MTISHPFAPWWVRPRIQIIRIAVIAIVFMALWVPFLFWFAEPDRQLMPNGAELFVFGTAAFQVISIVTAAIFVALMTEWDEVLCRKAARFWRWISLLPGLVIAFLLLITIRDDVPLGDTGELMASAAAFALMIAVALVSSRWPRTFVIVGLAQSTLVVVTIVALTQGPISPAFAGPATAYVVALALAATAAGYEHSFRLSLELRSATLPSPAAQTTTPR